MANHNKLDLKLSSYRKVSSFLTHCQALGLLTVQENQGVSTITSLHKTHDLFRGVKVENPELFKSHVLTSTTVSNTTTDSSTSEPVSEFAAFQAAHSVNQSGDKNKKVQVLELFKLTKHLKVSICMYFQCQSYMVYRQSCSCSCSSTWYIETRVFLLLRFPAFIFLISHRIYLECLEANMVNI